jgi:hypothetical protein
VVTGRCTGRGHGMTRRVWSVFSVCTVFSLMIGRAARPVTDDQMRLIIQGAYWTLTRRGHCRVWSLREARPIVVSLCATQVDQRVRSVAGPVRPVTPDASGQYDQRVRSVFQNLAVARPACPVILTSASGQRDFGWLKFLMAIFKGVRYK